MTSRGSSCERVSAIDSSDRQSREAVPTVCLRCLYQGPLHCCSPLHPKPSPSIAVPDAFGAGHTCRGKFTKC